MPPRKGNPVPQPGSLVSFKMNADSLERCRQLVRNINTCYNTGREIMLSEIIRAALAYAAEMEPYFIVYLSGRKQDHTSDADAATCLAHILPEPTTAAMLAGLEPLFNQPLPAEEIADNGKRNGARKRGHADSSSDRTNPRKPAD